MRMKAAWVVLLLLFVSGCGKQGYEVIYQKENTAPEGTKQKQERPYTIVLVPKIMNIPYFNAVQEGAAEAGEALGVNVRYEGPVAAEASQQTKIIEKLIAEKVDVIAVSANDPEGLLPVLEKAREQHIHVITWDADTRQEGREFFVNMVDPEALGRHLMDTLAWNTNEEGEFAIITGSKTAANLNEWLKWIQAQQRDNYPKMKLVQIAESDDDPQKAYAAAKEILQQHPRLKGIIGNSSVGPPAAAKAVKDLKLDGKVAVVGLSSPNPMNEYLKDGSAQMTTLWSPKKLGYLTVVLAHDLLQGKLPADREDVAGVGKIRVKGDVVIMGEPIDFTKENVDQYDF
ncbi:autoinducer 2 ABC transporter substrate-binding protein [Ectobacillus ponti]|uniref:Autoinducer 2 ABC transporter substrate-binding protein n=1 Tax=Ectobacillus ponti TaxID=2961894 RepID=A0AA42BNA4_9BACI|nr:autoinducer 2 ABC transporter substrate-binding protein [Ectobacillus ponti]MCP8967765.1 autoinducer 2 ABC transporter substrate-binding protein [Ectobacillus ponti]